MNQISGEIIDGAVSLHESVDWPNGTKFIVTRTDENYGIDDSQWPTTVAEIEDWVAWFDALEPLELTFEEQSRIEAERVRSKVENVDAMRASWAEVEKLF